MRKRRSLAEPLNYLPDGEDVAISSKKSSRFFALCDLPADSAGERRDALPSLVFPIFCARHPRA